jgi:hypothetical protein
MELSNDIKVLKDLVTVLLAKVEALESENAALRAENAELRSLLNLNSKNSHKPPSLDGLSKKPGLPKGLPKKSGVQPGHKGKTLKMVKKPDEGVVHHVASCPCCAKVFSPADVVDVVQKRQVFDIPAPRMEVTEHQLGVVVCCVQYHLGSFPSEVSQPLQYGIRIKELSILLNNDYKLPLEKIEQLMGDQAERDIRCLKTKQKVATNFQTIKGAKHYARIQSFTSTLRKHSMNVLRHLIDVLDRKDIVFQAG